jgi:DNA-directed RNA polymerase subunit RPC12/RpoP
MSSTTEAAAGTNEVTECPKCSSKRLITYAEERRKQQCYNCKFFVFTDGRRWDIAPLRHQGGPRGLRIHASKLEEEGASTR